MNKTLTDLLGCDAQVYSITDTIKTSEEALKVGEL